MDFPKKQAQRLMPLYLLEYSEKLFENHPNPEDPWGGGGGDYTAGYGIDITSNEISVDTDVIATKSDIASMVTTTQLEDALDDYALKTDLPENVSDLNNDAGYTTQTWVENQGYITGITSSDVVAALGYIPGTSNFSGNYNDLTNKPDLSIYAESSDLATVATSGSYNDLTDKPTIGHGVLTIQVNGTNVKQFSANETAAKTANIIVPTKTSDLTNDSGFITSSDIPSNLCKYIDLGSGSYNPVITQTVLDTIATSPKDYVLLYNFTYQGATYFIKFQYMNTVNGYYFYQSYNVGKVVNNTLTECSMAFTMAIRISDGTPSMTIVDTTPTAGTGIRITGHSISVDSLTVAMKSDLPTVNDPTITFTQGGVTKGSITLNQSSNQTIALDAAGSSYSAGTGIDITNNEISIDNTVALKSELFSGDYNDLTNKPTIPTVNDNTITITQGGVTKGSFTLNQNTNQTIEVDDVPDFEYHNGNKFTNSNYISSTGYITNGQKELTFTITLPKLMTNITSVTVNKLECLLRGVGGYVNGSSNINYVGQSGYTITTYIAAPNMLTITVLKTSPYSSSTNNTPVNVAFTVGGLELTFNQ